MRMSPVSINTTHELIAIKYMVSVKAGVKIGLRQSAGHRYLTHR